MEKVEKCAFMNENLAGKKGCTALHSVDCEGYDTECGFYKSRRQHIKDTDRAIDNCREKGLCENCKYNPVPCQRSDEKGGADNG